MKEYWFRPKARGYGAGMPIHWKGWVLFAALLAAIVASPSLITWILGYEGTVVQRLCVVALIVLPFLWLAERKTEGGWRWRNGDEEPKQDESGPDT